MNWQQRHGHNVIMLSLCVAKNLNAAFDIKVSEHSASQLAAER